MDAASVMAWRGEGVICKGGLADEPIVIFPSKRPRAHDGVAKCRPTPSLVSAEAESIELRGAASSGKSASALGRFAM